MAQSVGEVQVQGRGALRAADREYAREKVGHVLRLATGTVLFARVDLTLHADPARDRPAFAKAEVDVDGRVVRAHAAGTTVAEAVDLLEARLAERMEQAAHTEESRHLRHRGRDEWHHGDPAAPRPAWYPRPAEEREVVRHKTFAVGASTPDEAVLDLEQLDHDFYMFRNADTDDDNVLARTATGYELHTVAGRPWTGSATAPVTPARVAAVSRTLAQAEEVLDEADVPFVFFVDPVDRRGRVLYRRYDGHYGLIVPADGPPVAG